VLSKEQLHAQISDPLLCSAAHLSDLSSLQLTYPYATTFSILYLKTLANEQDVRLATALEQYAFGIQNRALLYELLTQPVTQVQSSMGQNQLEDDPVDAVQPIDELDQIMRASLINTSFVDLTYTEELAALDQHEPKQLEDIPVKTEQEDVQPLKDEAQSALTFSQWLHFNDLEETETKEFLKIEKPKQDFYSPAKKAKESLSSTQIPVSETLAKVYAMQGAVAKAIGVYEQLILLNPEKKSFFANQIKTLKKNLNASS
jgi:phosphopantetheinyl transferase (holo-ACP synthase)